MTNHKDARAERSKFALIQAGMTLLAENRDATLSDVAQVANVGRATLYRHFETRDQLIEAVAINCLETFDDATSSIDRDAKSWLDAIRLLFSVSMPLQNEMTFLMKLDSFIGENKNIKKIYHEQNKELRYILKKCQKENSIRSDISVDWLMALLDGLFFAAWKMILDHKVSHQQAAQLAFQSFCQGVRS